MTEETPKYETRRGGKRPGAGRKCKPGEAKLTMTFRADSSTLEILERHPNKSEFIREAIASYENPRTWIGDSLEEAEKAWVLIMARAKKDRLTHEMHELYGREWELTEDDRENLRKIRRELDILESIISKMI